MADKSTTTEAIDARVQNPSETGNETQFQLVWRAFKAHRLARISLWFLVVLYGVALFVEFLAPNDPHKVNARYTYAPPQAIRFLDRSEEGLRLRPHVLGYTVETDPESLSKSFVPDPEKKFYIEFLPRTHETLMWGFIPTERHLFGVSGRREVMFLMGTDRLGRDVFSRLIYGTRVTLSIGLAGIMLSLVFGVVIGGISGYYRGWIDGIIQRVIEFIRSIPAIPLWMGLAATLPRDWPPIKIYFAITIILSLIGWTELARVVRSRFLSINGEDYVSAARLDGVGDGRIILRHMAPALTSHIIATATLAIPGMILAETSLSFLGLGLQAPVISWGVLLQEAQNIRALVQAPWLFLPGLAIIATILAMNFLGDGLRDAADPYSTKH